MKSSDLQRLTYEQANALAWKLLEVSRDGLAIVDEDFCLIQCNASFARHLGYKSGELIGRHIWDWNAVLTQNELCSLLSDRNHLPESIETRHRCRDGTLVDVEVRLTSTTMAGHDYIMIVSHDITRQKQEREALLKTRFAMDSARDSCTWVNGDGRIVYGNQAACKALGYTREEILNLTIYDIDPDYTPQMFVRHKKGLKEAGALIFESRHMARDGRTFPVEISANYFGDEQEFMSCSFARDITARKAAEIALEKNNALLEQRVAERTSLLALIAQISADFVAVTPATIKQAMADALERIGTFFNFDRVVFFPLLPETVILLKNLEWCAKGIESRLGILADHPIIGQIDAPWIKTFQKKAVYHFPRVDKIPAQFEKWKTSLQTLGVESALFIASKTDKDMYGIVAFEVMGPYDQWSGNQINGLKVMAQIFAHAIAGIKSGMALHEAQKNIEVSRAAGMAEVATDMLHNVGNVLNSINISAGLLKDRLNQSRMGNLQKLTDMMPRSNRDLAEFFSMNARGRHIPGYLRSLANALKEEQEEMLTEAVQLGTGIEHAKQIIAMQQRYGCIHGVIESLAPEHLIEDAIRMNHDTLKQHHIQVERRFEPVPPITTDRHLVLQILINLIENAKNACTEKGIDNGRIRVHLFSHAHNQIRIQVKDNGIGIAPENLSRIFGHGFTTRHEGHGFGLHSGALFAKQLKGSLTAQSQGLGCGATFTLELPLSVQETI